MFTNFMRFGTAEAHVPAGSDRRAVGRLIARIENWAEHVAKPVAGAMAVGGVLFVGAELLEDARTVDVPSPTLLAAMTPSDKEIIAKTADARLDSQGESAARVAEWANPGTGRSGAVEALSYAPQPDEKACRVYRLTVQEANGDRWRSYMEYCRQDGRIKSLGDAR